MSATAYYNEIDPYAAQWLRNLIAAGHIAPGIVDERSIEDVHPSDLAGFTQCHFFAGIGVWSYALRRAGWPDDRPTWTGSCPCQPFSAAGKGAGFDDQRHLWPHFHWLIQERRPPVVYGEQVASKDAEPWLDLVRDDLEGLAYAFGAVAFPSAGVGAPHIRDRTFWMAQSKHRGFKAGQPCRARSGAVVSSGFVGRVGHPERLGAGRHAGASAGQESRPAVRSISDDAGSSGATGGLADSEGGGWREECKNSRGVAVGDCAQGVAAGLVHGGSDRHAGPTNGLWADADWLLCRDGKWRPVEPGTFPLAHGAAARVGRLRAYGNAINAEAARVFIEATMKAAA